MDMKNRCFLIVYILTVISHSHVLRQIHTLNQLTKSRPMFMLFAGNDQWAPTFHMTDIARLQAKAILSSNIFMTYLPDLQHDYVSHDGMPAQVVGWCYQCISSLAMNRISLSSSLQHQTWEKRVTNDVLVPVHGKDNLRAKL
jgi:hypothetical protein